MKIIADCQLPIADLKEIMGIEIGNRQSAIKGKNEHL
jgi:hypothetical protein